MSAYPDILAEIELTMVPSLRTRPDPGMYVPSGELPEAAPRGRSCRRTFWCSLKEQMAEVQFETKPAFGFPRLVGVKRCSTFDEPEDVACGRNCLDSDFRRRWPSALPTAGHRRSLGD
jgi:hypothetical protein